VFEDCCDLGVESVLCVVSGGVGDTTSSLHWGPFAVRLLVTSGARVWVPVGVWMGCSGESEGGTD
jgi:hypothetical protein